jgi:hypothetical protein
MGNGQSSYARLAELQIASSIHALPPAQMYRALKAYYASSGLYDQLAYSLRIQGIATEALKPLRNPTFRTVEYYVGHVWPCPSSPRIRA